MHRGHLCPTGAHFLQRPLWSEEREVSAVVSEEECDVPAFTC